MKSIGYLVMIIGLWMMVSPQAVLGLKELLWMSKYAFAGEAFIGAIVCAVAFLFIKPSKIEHSKHNH